MATYSSILAWRILWTEEAWRAAVHGVTKSQTRLSLLVIQLVGFYNFKNVQITSKLSRV